MDAPVRHLAREGVVRPAVIRAISLAIGMREEDHAAAAAGARQPCQHGDAFFRYITHDKGHGRRLTEFGTMTLPDGLSRIEDWPNLADAMARRGWPESRAEAVLGGNWVSFLKEVWGA